MTPGNYGAGNYGAGTYGDPSGERVAVIFEPPSEQLMVHVTLNLGAGGRRPGARQARRETGAGMSDCRLDYMGGIA